MRSVDGDARLARLRCFKGSLRGFGCGLGVRELGFGFGWLSPQALGQIHSGTRLKVNGEGRLGHHSTEWLTFCISLSA